MKRLLLILLTLYSQASDSQKIEENKFDKFDSIYKISTKMKYLSVRFSGINICMSILRSIGLQKQNL